MDTKLKKERLYLFSPCAMVATVVTVEGEISQVEMIDAINKAAKNNDILNTEIHMEPDQSAGYHLIEKDSFPVFVTEKGWQELVREQVKTRFDLEKGELIRFFLKKEESKWKLIILNHHLAGDGLSIAYLVEDIMNCLVGKEMQRKAICLMNPEDNKSVLPLFTRFMAKNLNKTWERSKTIFTDTDRKALFEKYWANRNVRLFSHTFGPEELKEMTNFCKKKEITMNSLLLTACYYAGGSNKGIGVSVDCRPRDSKTMGNYAIGVSVPYEYNYNLSFEDNAARAHALIYSYLNNDKKKLFLMQFMNAISGTLMDAAYFAGLGDYQDKTAGMMADMFGYNSNPQGVSLSNLTRLPIASDYGIYHLSEYRCIPPLVPNLKRIIGAATLNEQLNITMNVEDGTQIEEESKFFNRVVEILQDLGESLTFDNCK